MQEKLGDFVVGRHGDDRGRLGAARDRGRVGPVVEPESDNSADVAFRR